MFVLIAESRNEETSDWGNSAIFMNFRRLESCYDCVVNAHFTAERVKEPQPGPPLLPSLRFTEPNT
jgi:hypothetical protein